MSTRACNLLAMDAACCSAGYRGCSQNNPQILNRRKFAGPPPGANLAQVNSLMGQHDVAQGHARYGHTCLPPLELNGLIQSLLSKFLEQGRRRFIAFLEGPGQLCTGSVQGGLLLRFRLHTKGMVFGIRKAFSFHQVLHDGKVSI